ncbi:hypothetical protein LT330_002980 [Penicillium expansum]|nr:hypothetical protein LT330_002980 [Penicillium expansum]
MAEPAFSKIENYLSDEDSDDETSFGLTLEESGEDGGYHTQNDPKNPWQRQTITERRGPVDIRCKSREVIHGRLSPESSDEWEYATFLVYDFFFNAMQRFRRIASVNITFEFSSSEPGTPGPQIYAASPFGQYSMMEVEQEETYMREGEAKADVSPVTGANLGGSYKWSREISRTTTHDTRLIGNTITDKYGREIGVNWALLENDETNTGVPSFMRTAILLKRQQNTDFECSVKIKTTADWKTELKRFSASKGKDDPILFDPELPPTNNLRKDYDTRNLGESAKPEDCIGVTFYTTLGNVVKTRVQGDEKGVANVTVQSVSEGLA